MLNHHGRATFWVVVFLAILALCAFGLWLTLNDGLKGTVAGTWEKLRAATIGTREAVVPFVSLVPKKTVTEPPAAEPPADPLSTEESTSMPDVGAPVDSTSKNTGSPVIILKACIQKLQHGDLIGTEQYVSENGMRFTQGRTIGIHEVLWKGLFKLHSYDEVGYDQARVTGQTAWIPLYTRLGETRMVTMLIMANRGDGWKLDHLIDARKY